MGFLDKITRKGGLKDKAVELAKEHDDKVDLGIERAADAADRATKGKYTDKIDQAAKKAKDAYEEPPGGGTFAGHGVDVRAGGPDLVLPLSLTTGAWLLDRAGWTGSRTYTTSAVPVDGRVALLVMADGSARRGVTAPGWLDDRAEAFDAAITAALADGDADALASLDVHLGDDLLAAGPRALVVLGELTKGADVSARLRWEGAPFGVGYWVATWSFSHSR